MCTVYLLFGRGNIESDGSSARTIARAQAATEQPEPDTVSSSGRMQVPAPRLTASAAQDDSLDANPLSAVGRPDPAGRRVTASDDPLAAQDGPESTGTLARAPAHGEAAQLEAVTAPDHAGDPPPPATGATGENPATLTTAEPDATARASAAAAPDDEAVSELTRTEQRSATPAAEGVEQLTLPEPAAAPAQAPSAAALRGESPSLLTAPQAETGPPAPADPATPVPRAEASVRALSPAMPPVAARDVLDDLQQMMATARYSEGAVVARQTLQQQENGRVRALLVEFAARAGEHGAAVQAAEALDAANLSDNTLFWSGYSRLHLGQAQAAAQDFRAALARNGADPRYWFYQGLALQESGRHNLAIESFHRARELAPDLPEIAYNTGLSWWALGERDRASAAFRHFMAATAAMPHRYAAQRERLVSGYLSR